MNVPAKIKIKYASGSLEYFIVHGHYSNYIDIIDLIENIICYNNGDAVYISDLRELPGKEIILMLPEAEDQVSRRTCFLERSGSLHFLPKEWEAMLGTPIIP